jgi:hypothetical protein
LAYWFFINPICVDDVAKVLWQWAKDMRAELDEGVVSVELWGATSGNCNIYRGKYGLHGWKDDFNGFPDSHHEIFSFFQKTGICPSQAAMTSIMEVCNSLHGDEVLVYTCEQKHGQLVYVPPGWIHIVYTQKVPCMKLAWDAVYLENLAKYVLVARDIACAWFGNSEADMKSEPFNSYDWMKVQKLLSFVVEECIEVIPELDFPCITSM